MNEEGYEVWRLRKNLLSLYGFVELFLRRRGNKV